MILDMKLYINANPIPTTIATTSGFAATFELPGVPLLLRNLSAMNGNARIASAAIYVLLRLCYVMYTKKLT